MASQQTADGSQYSSTYSSPRSGVVDYPISQNMALTGIWNHEPNIHGPLISAEHGALDISRSPQQNAPNQWTKLSIQHYFDVDGGVIITFKIRLDVVQPPTEVKISLACGIILRYDGSVLRYCCWDPNTEWFHSLGRSSIQVGDGKFCRVALYICPDAVHIFENGNRMGIWRTRLSSRFQPIFNWQILSTNASMQATLSEIYVVTDSFRPSSNTPWDISFMVSSYPLADDVWQITSQDHGPFRVEISPHDYVRIFTHFLSFRNSWIFTQATSPILSSDGILMYKFRINMAGGTETKVTLFGGHTLHITKNGRHAGWKLHINQRHIGSEGEGDGVSNIRVGSGAWTVVTIIYSPSSTTLFEDGVFKFSSSRRALTSPQAPIFHVQHLDAGTAVEVDLSHVRCIPMLKTSEVLLRDLKSHIISRCPSSNNLYDNSDDDSASMEMTLDICPVLSRPLAQISVRRPSQATESAISMVYRASCVSPLLESHIGTPDPISSLHSNISTPPESPTFTFSSYTLALWLKVEKNFSGEKDNPSTENLLSLRPDGRLELSFWNEDTSSSGSELQWRSESPSPLYISNGTLPLSQWVSVIVTYAFEESRLMLFIDGEIDSVFYTTPSTNLSSPDTFMRITSCISDASWSNELGRLLNVEGEIGQGIFFKQHIQAVVARALANSYHQGDMLST